MDLWCVCGSDAVCWGLSVAEGRTQRAYYSTVLEYHVTKVKWYNGMLSYTKLEYTIRIDLRSDNRSDNRYM